MFKYLSGTVAQVEPNLIILDVGGVGFACSTSLVSAARVKVGESALIYTYLNVREDALDLFGFADEEELDCFKLLLGISGVGPKAALSILSAVTPSQLALAVATGDEKPFLSASGVGKKLAGRILLELKDKFAKIGVTADDISSPDVSAVSGGESDALAALSSLGYGRDEIAKALRGVDTSAMSTEDIVRLALTRLMR